MNRIACIAALPVFAIAFAATQSRAGNMTPYQTVLLSPSQDNIVIVDMETGTYMEIPIPDEVIPQPSLIAVDSDGAIYVYDSFVFAPETGARSVVARLDPTMSRWTTIILETDLVPPNDLDVKPDGNLIASNEFDVYDIDLAAQTIRLSGVQRTGEINLDGGTIAVEIASSGTIFTGGQDVNNTFSALLFRQNPDAEFAERFEPGVTLQDFVLDSDGTLIGVSSRDPESGDELDSGKLYRMNFDTNAVDLLFESEDLRGTRRIAMDPDGRIVTLSQTADSDPQIVRVDLDLGIAEIIADLEGHSLSDMDLRIVPEPSSVSLLVLGSLALSWYFGNRVKSYCR